MRRLGSLVAIASVLVLTACEAAQPSVVPGETTSEPTASATPSSSSPRPTADASPVDTQHPPFVRRVVTTLADGGLRVRSKPLVASDSTKLEPLLPLGTKLYVVDGPVAASGYIWYDVAPLASRKLPSGWVASADRAGQPWIAVADFECPPAPRDFDSLAALPTGVGLACFPRVPITVTARLLSCNCDIDGPGYSPDWFHVRDRSPFLVAPGVTTAPHDMTRWFALNLDPAGEHPGELPIGAVVEVTGVFDHPAAETCEYIDMDSEPVSSHRCGLEFAVTRLVLAHS